MSDVRCPGCGLVMPASERAMYDGRFNASAECWMVFTEVIGAEFANAAFFGQVHQLSVDAYAVQHAGGPHPDKSVAVHLIGLHLAIERGIPSTSVLRCCSGSRRTFTNGRTFEPPLGAWRTQSSMWRWLTITSLPFAIGAGRCGVAGQRSSILFVPDEGMISG